MIPKSKIIAVVGPTASGKTTRAVHLAEYFSGEIVSCDSRQVYSGMDIGTGKDLCEYGDTAFHLIDVCPAGSKYNLHDFLSEANMAVKEIQQRGNTPILCGGSGLYVESLLKGIVLPDVPENKSLRSSLEGKPIEELAQILASYKTLHNTTDIDSPRRAIRAIEIAKFEAEHPEYSSPENQKPLDAIVVGIDIDRQSRRDRITRRLKSRLNDGMIEEIESLLQSGISAEDLMYYGLEYKFVTQYVIGQVSYEDMFSSLEIAIHQFAKRQMTWFRGMERRGFHIHWLPYNMPKDEFLANVASLIC